MDSMARVFGMKTFLYTFLGAPHVPFSPGVGSTQSSTAYMDTTENLLRDFLADDLKRKVGLAEVLLATDVNVYPNPAHGQVVVDITKGDETEVRILDINGKTHYALNTNNKRLVLDIGDLNSGFYFVNIRNEYGSITRKMLVE